jgi:hypothetical protein
MICGAACPAEPPTRQINPTRVAQRVVSQRSSDRIAGARLLNRHAKPLHLLHDPGYKHVPVIVVHNQHA